MPNRYTSRPFSAWWRPRTSAWGAMLGEQEILLAAVALQPTGLARVVVFEHLHAPDGLVHPAERDDWLVQTLRGSGAHLPARLRTMALALGDDRCRQGVFEWDGAGAPRQLEVEIQLEAAAAWGVAADAVGFDFSTDPSPAHGAQVHWAACLREDLAKWRQHARSAGWRLPVVEPGPQAAQRAAVCLRGDTWQQGAESPQDWQFSLTPERDADQLDWPYLRARALWKPLVACGAALGALL